MASSILSQARDALSRDVDLVGVDSCSINSALGARANTSALRNYIEIIFNVYVDGDGMLFVT